MVLTIAYIVLFIVLLVIIIQDIKHRAIHIVLPVLLFFTALVINHLDHALSYANIAYNIIFIAVNVLGLFIYFSIKEKRFFNPIDSMLGLGDIFFFIAISPLFSLKAFIVFFVSGLIFSLIIHLVSNIFKKANTIPLAGYMSVFLSLNVFLKTIFKIEIPAL